MINFSKVKLLIVDMDNTLCDTFHSLSKHQWAKVEKVLAKRGHKDHALVFRKNFGRFSFKHTLEQLKLPKAERELAVRTYDAVNVRTLTLYPDAQAILDLDMPKVLVTRGEKKLQLAKIKHLKLKKHFDGIYYIPTFMEKKDAFRNIMKKYKLKPSQCLVIGDRIEEEIKDANKLKIPSILVRRPGWPVHKGIATPDLTVKSLKKVVEKLHV